MSRRFFKDVQDNAARKHKRLLREINKCNSAFEKIRNSVGSISEAPKEVVRELTRIANTHNTTLALLQLHTPSYSLAKRLYVE